uniref:Uncharacterized protein n=1 Tax=Meloidogyne hapla TaxID=6305 RepID=A0A1I8B3N0_MELHA
MEGKFNKINSSFSLRPHFLLILYIIFNSKTQRILKPFSQFDNSQLSQKEDEEQSDDIQNILEEENNNNINDELEREKLGELFMGMIIPNRYQRALTIKRGSLGPRPLRFGR